MVPILDTINREIIIAIPIVSTQSNIVLNIEAFLYNLSCKAYYVTSLPFVIPSNYTIIFTMD